MIAIQSGDAVCKPKAEGCNKFLLRGILRTFLYYRYKQIAKCDTLISIKREREDN